MSELDDLRARLDRVTLLDERRLRGRLARARSSAEVEQLAAEVAAAERKVESLRAAVPRIVYPENLPVSERREDLLATIGAHQVVVVAGETGSGKSTQLP